MKACLVSAPATGAGKTTVTIGLLATLKSCGYEVQAFKVGPDFIDPGLHEIVTGTPSHNLDGWMMSKETNQKLFAETAAGKDVSIVEGVMGLFDGFDGTSNVGSTAEIAAWLDLPIILVVDANALARSAAALIHGFTTFDPQLHFAGVIFNRVAGAAHFKILADAMKDVEVPVLGWLPRDPQIEIAERHLGLLTADEAEARARVLRIGEFFKKHVDTEQLLAHLGTRHPVARVTPSLPKKRMRIALARDPAFCFYYRANRIALELAGAEIIEFSPMFDTEIPEAEMLYIGGGYPELYRRQLESNHSMRRSVRAFIESGKRFYAECGGLMYLAERIEDAEMVGVVPTEIEMSQAPVDFGYCEVTTARSSILGPAGTRIRGQQFHYSRCRVASGNPIYRVKQGQREYGEGFAFENGVASYIHLHFLSNPDVVTSVLES